MTGKSPNRKDAQNAIETLVRYIEEINGPLREGLVDTPKRVIDAYEELYQGYTVDVKKLLDATFNAEGYDGIVLLRDIEFHSTCEHH
ncbi:MAG: GTP cyclohydrolase I FolE, partial [Euryarchaeota archaeon]|nr:GTP cyclohydrolase I FolE [Euryarchaeota archaeon]